MKSNIRILRFYNGKSGIKGLHRWQLMNTDRMIDLYTDLLNKVQEKKYKIKNQHDRLLKIDIEVAQTNLSRLIESQVINKNKTSLN